MPPFHLPLILEPSPPPCSASPTKRRHAPDKTPTPSMGQGTHQPKVKGAGGLNGPGEEEENADDEPPDHPPSLDLPAENLSQGDQGGLQGETVDLGDTVDRAGAAAGDAGGEGPAAGAPAAESGTAPSEVDSSAENQGGGESNKGEAGSLGGADSKDPDAKPPNNGPCIVPLADDAAVNMTNMTKKATDDEARREASEACLFPSTPRGNGGVSAILEANVGRRMAGIFSPPMPHGSPMRELSFRFLHSGISLGDSEKAPPIDIMSRMHSGDSTDSEDAVLVAPTADSVTQQAKREDLPPAADSPQMCQSHPPPPLPLAVHESWRCAHLLVASFATTRIIHMSQDGSSRHLTQHCPNHRSESADKRMLAEIRAPATSGIHEG